jgi:hypothetical protein
MQARLIFAATAGLMAVPAQGQADSVTQSEVPTVETAPLSAPIPEAGPALVPPIEVEEAGDESIEEGPEPHPLRGLSLLPGLTVPLQAGGPGGTEEGVRNASGPVATLTVRYTPREGWFALTTLSAYLKPSERDPWNGDFVYAFGYDNWRPNTVSLTYANYGNNRFSPRAGESATNLLRGVVSLGYKVNLPDVLAEPLLIDRSQKIGCRGDYRYAARYERVSGNDGHHKQWVSVGCRYPVWHRVYVDFTVHKYVHGEQRPWDPDFTYGFGWFDWRPGRFSLQYSNYSGNRFPWRRQPDQTGRLQNGAVSLTWSHSF